MSSNLPHVTSILSHKIKPNHVDEYLVWAKKISSVLTTQQGFQNITIIKPKDTSDNEYVVILSFLNYESLKKWKESDECKQLVNEAKKFTLAVKKIQEDAGLEIWFDWPKDAKYLPRPPKIKQILITVMIVLPFVITLSMILDRLEPMMPSIRIIILVVTISTYMAFVMPIITKYFHFWLYPTKK